MLSSPAGQQRVLSSPWDYVPCQGQESLLLQGLVTLLWHPFFDCFVTRVIYCNLRGKMLFYILLLALFVGKFETLKFSGKAEAVTDLLRHHVEHLGPQVQDSQLLRAGQDEVQTWTSMSIYSFIDIRI